MGLSRRISDARCCVTVESGLTSAAVRTRLPKVTRTKASARRPGQADSGVSGNFVRLAEQTVRGLYRSGGAKQGCSCLRLWLSVGHRRRLAGSLDNPEASSLVQSIPEVNGFADEFLAFTETAFQATSHLVLTNAGHQHTGTSTKACGFCFDLLQRITSLGPGIITP